jgi:glycosyltransferase involved in cell wall biosynthesis
MKKISITILMPCLNEVSSISICINKALGFLKKNDVDGEVLIADNGSSDGSQALALQHGARVINVSEKGYGNALFYGIQAAKGDFIIMADADDSYDFSDLKPFIQAYDEGYDFVIGNRFKGGIEPGAMPWKNQYIGNPILSFIGRLLFNINIRDFHCGLRGITKKAFIELDLRTTGMEFASEMVIKSSMKNIKVKEVPTKLYPDSRNRKPHLRPWRDGWRHLKFMSLYSPDKIFIRPGLILGIFLILIFFYQRINNLENFGILSHVSVALMLGFCYLLVLSGIFLKSFISYSNIDNKLKNRVFGIPYNNLTEISSLFHIGLMLISFAIFMKIFFAWSSENFNFLDINSNLNEIFCFCLTFIFSIVGLCFSLFLSVFNIPLRR